MKCLLSYTNCLPEIFTDNFVNGFYRSDIFSDISISISVMLRNYQKIFTDNFVNGLYVFDKFTDISVSISVSFSNFTELSVNVNFKKGTEI